MNILKIIVIFVICGFSCAIHNLSFDKEHYKQNITFYREHYKQNIFGSSSAIKITGRELYYDNFMKNIMLRCYNNLIVSIHPIINISLPNL